MKNVHSAKRFLAIIVSKCWIPIIVYDSLQNCRSKTVDRANIYINNLYRLNEVNNFNEFQAKK